MELLFLGTGAADYRPALFGEAADRFDRNARRSNALLLDGHLLIDCGDWILDELRLAGIDPGQIDRVLISHSHADHFRKDHLCELARRAGHPIRVYASRTVLDLLAAYSAPGKEWLDCRELQAEPVPIAETFDGWTVTPLRSNHQTEVPGEHTLHFLLEKDGKSLFYGTDGAWLPTATGKYLFRRRLDAYLFDATCGDYENDYRIFEHNTLPMIRMMVTVLREQGAFAPEAKLVLVHLAPSLHASHEETVKIAEKDGFLTAFDGMRMTI